MTTRIARPAAHRHPAQADIYLTLTRTADQAIPADRRAPRTVAPSTDEQRAVAAHRRADRDALNRQAQKMPDDGDDACPVCGWWTCRCGRMEA